MRKTTGTSASTMPAPVATPLPPVPLRKIEYMWPTHGRRGDEDRRPRRRTAGGDQRGMKPLRMSPIMTSDPGLLAEHAEDVGGADVAGAVLRTSTP